MRLKPIIDLVNANTNFFKVVTRADGLRHLEDIENAPSLILSSQKDPPVGPNRLIGGASQEVEGIFAGLIVAKASTESEEFIEDARDAFRVAILGKKPAPGYGPISYFDGELFELTTSFVYWIDYYKTTYCLRG